ncbi:MAG TPA: PEP-CTERM sorting domain-containing protein [Phycisphaerae bacterium]|nr:PEP-CTERM sorting domain-containing protein [Phycisphaerae bacterium]
MFTGRAKLMSLVFAGSMLLAAGSAQAQGVGNPGQLPVAIPMNTSTGWDISNGATGGPVPVVLDPLGPVWHKDLLPPPGAQIFGGQTYTLHELLVVAGNLPWTDYHEDILTPGWNWSNPSFLVNGVVPTGFSFVNSPGSISFFFNSIAPGSVVDIHKDLVYSGPVPAVFPSISVNQYPTPEPASLGLLAISGLWLLRRRR